MNPQHEIILSLAPILCSYAKKLRKSVTCSVEDLYQVGYLAALEALSKARKEDNTRAFLGRVATRAMCDAALEAWGHMRIPACSQSRESDERNALKQAKYIPMGTPVGEDGAVSDDLVGKPCNAESLVEAHMLVARIDSTVLRYLLAEADGDTCREIAAEEGCSYQTIRNRVNLAVHDFRNPKAA